MTNDELLQAAWERFDRINATDPTQLEFEGRLQPQELVRARQLTQWLERIAPQASLALRLASRCQHLGRFEVPRSSYPEGRVGYLTWRKELSRIHADRAGAILAELGAPDELKAAVRSINLKLDPRGNPEVQTMEDALCLSFLEHEFVPFIERWDDETVVGIVQKTWRKMSEHGHQTALGLPLSGRALELVQRALAPS
ncbi:MAG TPA: DUF4202 domain-containing protein [Polyangiaceae bacterium]|nr:DUF4202 domain-containing protein [Polyangiaceae bacterium]